MTPDIPQIDAYLPAPWLRVIGATKTFAARSQFYFSFPQFIMIATLFYYQSGLIQSVFPTIYYWVAFLFAVGLATMVFEYTVMFPSQITFNAGQNSRENRNPLFREVMALHRRLDELEPRLQSDGGQATVVPLCTECREKGVAGDHDGASAIVCPGCGDVLYRGV